MDARRLLALPLALLAIPASAGAATCAGADTPVSEASLTEAKAAVLCIVNAERTFRGLPALASNAKLALAAQRHAEDMAARDYFDHTSPEGTSPGDRIEAAGYTSWSTWGENIALGYRTPRSVMAAWMKSEGHCHNMLAPGFAEIGIGATAGAMWVQDFARSRSAAAPSRDSGPQNGCPYGALSGLDAPDSPPVTQTPPAVTTPPVDTTPPPADTADTPPAGTPPADTTTTPPTSGAPEGPVAKPKPRKHRRHHHRNRWRHRAGRAVRHHARHLR